MISPLRTFFVALFAMFPTKDAASKAIGGLSKPSKMPCPGWSIPAIECQLGAVLRKLGRITTCGSCYALKGTYVFPVVREAMARRFAILQKALLDPAARYRFIAAFVRVLINRPHFRWHDSGDLQSIDHFALICEIARLTPWCQHWLPTREYAYVKGYKGQIPDNLTVRLSAHLVDGNPPAGDYPTSTVDAKREPQGLACDAPSRDGHCGPCRACWDKDVSNVSYHIH